MNWRIRLDALGVQRRNRVFIGTVHSFALTQIVLPCARTDPRVMHEDALR